MLSKKSNRISSAVLVTTTVYICCLVINLYLNYVEIALKTNAPMWLVESVLNAVSMYFILSVIYAVFCFYFMLNGLKTSGLIANTLLQLMIVVVVRLLIFLFQVIVSTDFFTFEFRLGSSILLMELMILGIAIVLVLITNSILYLLELIKIRKLKF